jgi:hypothetical protein
MRWESEMKRRVQSGTIQELVLEILSAHAGKEVPLADIYSGVRAKIPRASESGIRMALQSLRPKTENTRRGFWRLA